MFHSGNMANGRSIHRVASLPRELTWEALLTDGRTSGAGPTRIRRLRTGGKAPRAGCLASGARPTVCRVDMRGLKPDREKDRLMG